LEHSSVRIDAQLKHPASVVAEINLTQRTDALVRGLTLTLLHHGASRFIRDELSRQVHTYLDGTKTEDIWLKCAKHMLTYPMAVYLRNEPPVGPEQIFQATGPLHKWLKLRLKKVSYANSHLWYSWLQAKRCTLPVSENVVRSTYEKHFATLSSEDKGDDDTINAIFDDRTFRSTLKKIRRQMMIRLGKSKRNVEYAASNSACFENTRGKGGQHQHLADLAGVPLSLSSELHSMRVDHITFGRSVRYNVVSEIRMPYGHSEWSTLGDHIEEHDSAQRTKCTIQAVLEPMKVRVISKEEAIPCYGNRALQKALHGSMRKMPCFRLIGRPVCGSDIVDVAKKAEVGDNWFSIDYSAATDGLSWKYSGRILEFLIAKMNERDRDFARCELAPHDLYYPSFDKFSGRTGKPEYRGEQNNGQLMGSILSFPILCLANLGVYLLNTQNYQSGWSNSERLGHVLINGDDMVYAAKEKLWATHAEIGKRVGLEMSVGKAYCHSMYLNINSVGYHYRLDTDDKRRSVREVAFLNAGLFYGQHKVQGRVDTGDEEALSSSYCGTLNTVLDGSLPSKRKDVLAMYLSEHAEDIKKECEVSENVRGRQAVFTRNLFYPISRGGMGVVPPEGWSYRTKPCQKLYAAWIEKQYSVPLTTQRPLPGYDLIQVLPVAPVPWSKPTTVKEQPQCGRLKFFYRKSHLSLRSPIIPYWIGPAAVLA
jgi:hypothetical protein